jgi:hypothetical protein
VAFAQRLRDAAGEKSAREVNGGRKRDLIATFQRWWAAFCATIAGIFSAENFGFLQEWFGFAERIFSIPVIIALGGMGIAVWAVLKSIDTMIVNDEVGAETPDVVPEHTAWPEHHQKLPDEPEAEGPHPSIPAPEAQA